MSSALHDEHEDKLLESPSKRPYHAPEMRRLGSAAAVTSSQGVPTIQDGPYTGGS